MKIEKKTIIICTILIFLSIIRIVLTYNYRIYPIMAGEDDRLMVKWAWSIIEGKWLGDYQYNTLMKGPIFSFILATLFKLKIRYLVFVNIFYVTACLYFIFSIRKLMKNKYLLIPLYAILIFNPIMFSREVTQRVYRNSLIPIFSILLISGYIGAYLNRNEKLYKYLFYILTLCGILPLFYYMREDSIWLVPYVVFMSFAIMISLLLRIKKEKWYLILLKIVALILPIICTSLLGWKIEKKNETFYGLKIKNALSDSNFVEAVRAIYAVKPNIYIDRVTVTQEKALRMAIVSPSFTEIYPKFSEYLGGYNSFDSNPSDFECEDGWFLWALRLATNSSGYRNIQQEEDIYIRIADELNYAMDNGLIEKQDTMPSALLSPYRKGYFNKIVSKIIEGFIYTSSYKDIAIQNEFEYLADKNTIDEAEKEYENLTKEKSLVLYENGEKLDSELEINTKIIKAIIFLYKITGIFLLILGIIGYIIIIIRMIGDIKNKKYDMVQVFITVSGILGLLFTLIAGIAYNDVATAYSIKALYLCGAYPLLTAFCVLSIIYGISCFTSRKLIEE